MDEGREIEGKENVSAAVAAPLRQTQAMTREALVGSWTRNTFQEPFD
jgi:hypothetical protein